MGFGFSVVGGISKVVREFSKVVGEFSRVVGVISKVVGGFSKVVGGISKVVGGFSKVVGAFSRVVGEFSKVVGRISKVVGGFSKVVGRISKVVEDDFLSSCHSDEGGISVSASAIIVFFIVLLYGVSCGDSSYVGMTSLGSLISFLICRKLFLCFTETRNFYCGILVIIVSPKDFNAN